MKILIVDDRIENLEAAKKQLSEHEVFVAQTLQEARSILVDFNVINQIGIDVVMTDVMMPAEEHGMGKKGEKYIGELVPVGLVVALLALGCNVSRVCIVSDTNHHDHPVAWALDSITVLNHKKVGIECYCGARCPKTEGIKDWGMVFRGE